MRHNSLTSFIYKLNSALTSSTKSSFSQVNNSTSFVIEFPLGWVNVFVIVLCFN